MIRRRGNISWGLLPEFKLIPPLNFGRLQKKIENRLHHTVFAVNEVGHFPHVIHHFLFGHIHDSAEINILKPFAYGKFSHLHKQYVISMIGCFQVAVESPVEGVKVAPCYKGSLVPYKFPIQHGDKIVNVVDGCAAGVLSNL